MPVTVKFSTADYPIKTLGELEENEFGIIIDNTPLNGRLVFRGMHPKDIIMIPGTSDNVDGWQELGDIPKNIRVRVMMPGESFTVTIN